MSYTKGKWEADGFDSRTGLCVWHDGRHIVTAEKPYPMTDENQLANAQRICHCHNTYDELLEVCKEAHKAIYEVINKRPANLSIIWHNLEDVISKAEGK
jgi:hypothetical protein